MPSFLKAATKQFLRRYKVKPHETGMRAVFLGDSVSNRVILDGLFEREYLLAQDRQIFGKLGTGAVALDIGANIGNHSCFMAQRFGRVVAFEPNPIVYHVLKANTLGRNIECHNLGLSNQVAELPFVVKFPNYGIAHIASEGEEPDITINVRPLDDMIGELGIDRIDFIKLDVDGHEIEVLEGATKTLATHKPPIAIEAMYRLDPSSGERTLGFLESLGYRYFYEFVPSPGLSAAIVSAGMASPKNPFRYLVPENIRKQVFLKQVPDLRNRDNDLCIVAASPLL